VLWRAAVIRRRMWYVRVEMCRSSLYGQEHITNHLRLCPHQTQSSSRDFVLAAKLFKCHPPSCSNVVLQEGLFRAVVTKEAFRSLSVEAQTYLKRFLPKYEGAEKEEERILDAVFTADPNFYFGNPLGKVHSKIRCGWFNPERPSDQVQLRDNRRVLYDHYIRYYHISLLKKLLVSRRKLLEHFANLGGNEEPTYSAPDPALVRKRNTTARLKARAEYRTRLMIEDVKKKVDETGFSSDEEVVDEPSPSKIPLTAAGRSTLYSPNFVDLDLHQPIYMNDVKDMLKEYQRLKELEPDSPSLDITEIAVEDVYERAGLACIAEKNLPAEISEAMKQPLKPTK
uniref:Nuclear factor related to kappa-B-binding protein n=1 Tax=Parascaris univalens TaxID=6257 RepID=A0A915C9D7_PARUN